MSFQGLGVGAIEVSNEAQQFAAHIFHASEASVTYDTPGYDSKYDIWLNHELCFGVNTKRAR